MTADPVTYVRRALIEIAAALVRGEHLPTCFEDGNFYQSTPKCERRRILTEIDRLGEHGKTLGIRLRELSDMLPRPPGPKEPPRPKMREVG